MTGIARISPIHHYYNSSSQEAQCDFLPSDEDWSQIEDKAKRRRVQNKAAQRRFRRKMRTQSSASDQQLESMSLPSSARISTNTESVFPHFDLLRVSSRQQTARDRTQSLIWNSRNPISSHHASNNGFLTYMHHNQEDTMLPSPSNYLSAESPSPLVMPAKSLPILEDSRWLHHPEMLNHVHRTPPRALSSATVETAQSPPTSHKNMHAERLVNRIHNTVDELSMLYDIGIELELMHKDDQMAAQLEALKRGFDNLATRST